MRILIVEDNELLADSLRQLLNQPGWAVDRFATGEQAELALRIAPYDLAIIDIGLPGMDGFELLRRLRRGPARGNTGDQPHDNRDTPVLMLTARDAVADRIHGLDLGADDYLVKPFALGELEARVRALLRRRQASVSQELECGRLRMDSRSRRAWIGEAELVLTLREWAILEYLLAHQEQVVGKERIARAVSTWEEDIAANTIEVHVSRLRKKVAPAGIEIRGIRGFGYLLEPAREGGCAARAEAGVGVAVEPGSGTAAEAGGAMPAATGADAPPGEGA
ncbi:response regulator [Derxia gummosa]|uniref:Response regulator n=1 Tax=Derxia gummosa DSM 723 TaxID=1121388 RepID=A0A8B6XB76_9BURK|nr:response regulator transcription factor [Derxia gummosa]